MVRIRRLLGWAVFLGFLGAVGFGVFQFVRDRPRLTTPDVLFLEYLSPDGSRLVTTPWIEFGQAHQRGPLQVWDARRGLLMHEFFRDVKEAWFQMSPDGATVAAGLGDGTLWLVDWRSAQAWRVDDVDLGPLPQRNTSGPGLNFGFSTKGRWIFADHGAGKPTHFVDVASKKVLWRSMEKFEWADSNERLAFARNQENIDVWDLDAGRRVASLPARFQEMAISPDGKTLLTRRVLPPPSPPYVVHGIDVWDLTSFTMRFQRDWSPAGKLEARFSPDGRTLALWLRQEQFESNLALVDVATGQLRWSYRMKSANCGQFAADGSVWMLQHEVDLKSWTGTLTVFDVATGRVLWEKPGNSYLIGSNGVLHQDKDGVSLLDSPTGECRGAKLLVLTGSDEIAGKLGFQWRFTAQTSDETHFVVRSQRARDPNSWESWLSKLWPSVFADTNSATVVIETATGRESGRLGNVANHSFRTMISNDGNTLVTSDIIDEKHRMVRVWDVQPTRAWRLAVGVAAATGVALLALRCAWRRRKAYQAQLAQR